MRIGFDLNGLTWVANIKAAVLDGGGYIRAITDNNNTLLIKAVRISDCRIDVTGYVLDTLLKTGWIDTNDIHLVHDNAVNHKYYYDCEVHFHKGIVTICHDEYVDFNV